MVKNKHGRLAVLPAVIVGMISAWVMCLSAVAVIARLTLAQRIGEKGINFLIPIIIAATVLAGGRVASVTVSGNHVVASLAVSGAFCLGMLVVGMSLDGTFDNVLANMAGVLLGCGISCALCIKKKGRVQRRKKALLLK